MANNDYVFIRPANGKPIFLIDRSEVVNGKPMEISYSQDMVDKGVALKVKRTPFILGRVSGEQDIVIVDKDDVKYSSDDYFRDRAKELKEIEAANVEKKAEAIVESFEAFTKAAEKSIGLTNVGKHRKEKAASI